MGRWFGLIKRLTKDFGITTKCMVKERCSGLMAQYLMVDNNLIFLGAFFEGVRDGFG